MRWRSSTGWHAKVSLFYLNLPCILMPKSTKNNLWLQFILKSLFCSFPGHQILWTPRHFKPFPFTVCCEVHFEGGFFSVTFFHGWLLLAMFFYPPVVKSDLIVCLGLFWEVEEFNQTNVLDGKRVFLLVDGLDWNL